MGSLEKRTEMWNSMLDAEMNEIYWSGEAQRHGAADRVLKVFIALSSSGTAIALFAALSLDQKLGKALALVASALSLVHSIFFSTNRLKLVTALAARWKEIAIEYRLLWAELESAETIPLKAWRKYEVVCQREKQIDESAFRINPKRLSNAQDQVIMTRNLN